MNYFILSVKKALKIQRLGILIADQSLLERQLHQLIEKVWNKAWFKNDGHDHTIGSSPKMGTMVDVGIATLA